MALKNVKIRMILGTAAGAAAGFAYYYYIGCVTGTCPLTSNPWLMTAYGAAVGATLTMPGKRKSESNGQ